MTKTNCGIVNQPIALTSFALLILSGWGSDGYVLLGQDTDTLPMGRHLVPKIDSSNQESTIQGSLSASFRSRKGMGVEIASLHPNVAKSQFVDVGSSIGRPLQKGEIVHSLYGVRVTSEAELFRRLRGRKDSCPIQLRNIANGTLSSGVVTLRNGVPKDCNDQRSLAFFL